MYLIFLDMDGVVVPEQAYFYWEGREDGKRKEYRAPRCCPIAISNLNYVCKNVADLNIVISSTWRKFFDLDDMKTILEDDGFKYADRIIGVTPTVVRSISDSNGRRGTEIENWLAETKDPVKDWVALDDHAFNIDKEHLVLTGQEMGFTILDAYALIERFNPEWERPMFLM
jgi:hypothetical protein